MAVEGQDRAEHIQQKYGLSSEQTKVNRQNLIDRGLDVYIFKVGTYKSAVEPYPRNDMSY